MISLDMIIRYFKRFIQFYFTHLNLNLTRQNYLCFVHLEGRPIGEEISASPFS